MAVAALQRAGVQLLTGVSYEAIEPGVVQIRDASGEARRIAADTVIVCAGQEADAGLATALQGAGVPHIVIGGAAQAGELDAERAFREGAQVPPRIAGLIGSRA